MILLGLNGWQIGGSILVGVSKGGLVPTNPAFGPTEQGGMLGMSKLGRYESIPNDSDTLENFGFLTRIRRDFFHGFDGILTRI